MKKIIKLTESDLSRMVKKILNEKFGEYDYDPTNRSLVSSLYDIVNNEETSLTYEDIDEFLRKSSSVDRKDIEYLINTEEYPNIRTIEDIVYSVLMSEDESLDEGFDDPYIQHFRGGKDFSEKEFKKLPSKMDYGYLRDDSITPTKYVQNRIDDIRDELIRRLRDRGEEGDINGDEDDFDDYA